MKVLVWTEHDNAVLKDATLHAVSAGTQLGAVTLLVAGAGCAGVAEAASHVAGVDAVLLADDAAYGAGLAENIAPLVVGLMGDFDVFLAPATTTGKNIAPRIAALLDVMQISDILTVEGPRSFTRPIYAGNAIATVESRDARLVITARTTGFAKAEATGGSATVSPASGAGAAGLSSLVSAEIVASERPDLTSARVIVSGGRALKDAQTFRDIVYPLADRLGAAVGASRAAVDAGFVSNDHQVGQTGKIVAPEAYIAVGISGAIQHLAGMKDSKTIIAINKDPDAPIFQIADLGLVGDLYEVVPALVTSLGTRE